MSLSIKIAKSNTKPFLGAITIWRAIQKETINQRTKSIKNKQRVKEQ